MKTLTIQQIALFLFICLLTGCIKEEDSGDRNTKNGVQDVKVAFRCISDSVDIFEQEITKNKTFPTGGAVSLYVYNKETGTLVTKQVASNSALKEFQGTTLSLEPGIYEIRCWANMDAQTVIYGEDKLSTARLSNQKYYPNQQVVTSDDPLYYGATTLTVPLKGFVPETVADTILFKTAHLHFDLELTGSGAFIPKIEVRNLDPTFDFEMKKTGQTTSYFPEIIMGRSPVVTQMRAQFNILRTAYRNGDINYDQTKNIEIRVTDPAEDTLVYSVNLKDWMDSYGITINASNDNNLLSLPDSLLGSTSGTTSFPPIAIEIADPGTTTPTDTITPPPADTIPAPPVPVPPVDTTPPLPPMPLPPADTVPADTVPIPPIEVPPPTLDKQGLFFYLYKENCQDDDIFSKVIQSVNLYVYEKASGNQINTPKDIITKSDLNAFTGYRFALPPINLTDTTTREYEIRCWANVGANTVVRNQHHLVVAGVSHTNYAAGDINTNDELYFGRATARVKGNYTYVTEDIDFKIAHTRFEINVIGMDTIPIIEVTGLPASCDFYMSDQQWPSKKYTPKVTSTASDTTFIFQSFRLTNQNKDNVKITITDGKQSWITETVSLKDALIQINESKCYDYIYINNSPSGTNTIRITVKKVGTNLVTVVSS